MKRKYNRVKDVPDARDHHYNDARPMARPPVVDLSGKCSAVVDQGEESSCTANAIIGALEYEENIQSETVIQLSRQFVYTNEQIVEGDQGQDDGAQIRDGIKVIATYGACSEALWPYLPENMGLTPSQEAYADGLNHKALVYASVEQTENAITHALAAGYPVIIGIQVYDSFESDAVAANGLVPMPVANEPCQGGHAVLVVGYDYNKRLFKVRNSWGPDWGDHGYFYLPFDYVLSPDLAEDFWIVRKIS